MKKNIFLTAAVATCLAFTACEKVEAPYVVKPNQPSTPAQPNTPAQPAADGTLLKEDFSTSLGAFTTVTTAGTGEWKIDYKTAKATGYDNKTKKTTAGTYYLVSPELDLTNVKEAHVAFEYVLRYNKGDENQQLLISDKYDAQKAAEGWTVLNQKWTEGRDWKTFSKADLDIPAAWMGKKVRIAFRYNTNAESGSTWEVKNLNVATGKAAVVADKPAEPAQPEQPAKPEQPTPPMTPAQPTNGDNLLQNGSFEDWTDSKPNHWMTDAHVGNAKVAQNATAQSGKTSVEVSGEAKANKRLGSSAVTLEAGTYTFSAYVRGTADGASCRLGYVPFKDGQLDFKNYVYQEGYNDNLPTAEWKLVSYTFTLQEKTTLHLVVMIPKGKPAFLLDNATLLKK